MPVKRLLNWAAIVSLVGCATVDAPTDEELADNDLTDGTGGDAAGSGGESIGSGGLILGSSGGSSSGSGGMVASDGGTSSGGVVIGGDGDGDTGGGLVGDGDTGGSLVGDGDGDTGGMPGDGDGDTGGMTASGGSATPGSPGDCLLDWDLTVEADACLDAGQEDRVSGCTNLLDCWQANDCTPAECSALPDDMCGQNTVMNATPGRSYADDVYAALCQ